MELNWAPSTAAAVLDPVFKRWAERKAGRQRRVDAFLIRTIRTRRMIPYISRLRRALDESEPEAPKQKKKRKRRVVVESEEEEDDEDRRRRRTAVLARRGGRRVGSSPMSCEPAGHVFLVA